MLTSPQQHHQTCCDQLWKELITLEFQHLTDSYGGTNNVSVVPSSIGPLYLYYAKVDVEGSPVEALVDLGSAATLISFNLFKQTKKSPSAFEFIDYCHCASSSHYTPPRQIYHHHWSVCLTREFQQICNFYLNQEMPPCNLSVLLYRVVW